MPQVRITEAVQVNGEILVPGVQEMGEAALRLLAERGRGHLVQALDQPAEPTTTDGESADPLAEFPEIREAGYTADPLAEFPEIREAGYTAETAAAASDDELLALPRVGRATVHRLREALGGSEAES